MGSCVLRLILKAQKDQLLKEEKRMVAASDIEWGKRVESRPTFLKRGVCFGLMM